MYTVDTSSPTVKFQLEAPDKMYSLSVLLLTFAFISGIDGCPNGWIQHDASCYFFSTQYEHWTTAFEACAVVLKGQLAEVSDAVENNFLLAEAAKLGGSYWIGATDIEVEGEWKWMSSEALVEYKDWLPGEPNDDHDQDCVRISQGAWDDYTCNQLQHYICERSADVSPIVG